MPAGGIFNAFANFKRDFPTSADAVMLGSVLFSVKSLIQVRKTMRTHVFYQLNPRDSAEMRDLDTSWKRRRAIYALALATAAPISSREGLRRRVRPPFTCRVSPVMKHSSLASHTAAAATSSLVP